jgi:predicted small metal-binding protein
VKTLTCGDVIAGCRTRISAPDISGVLGQLVGHVSREHGADISVALLQKARQSVVS